MLIKVIKYMIKEPFNKIALDFEEYKAIRHKYFEAEKEEILARKRLNNSSSQTCLREWWEFIVDSNNEDMMPHLLSDECESFNSKVPCKNSDCPCYLRNKEYFQAIQKRKSIRSLKNKFWINKFTLTK